MKMRGFPATAAGCITPGEKARMWPKTSPLPMPSDRAYEAPSEKPVMASRRRSMAQRLPTTTKARRRQPLDRQCRHKATGPGRNAGNHELSAGEAHVALRLGG